MDSERSTISYRFTMNQLRDTTYAIRNTKLCKTNPISTVALGESCVIYAKNITKNCKKFKIIRTLCNFWTLTHLTPYTTKTYIIFHLPKAVLPQNTLHNWSLPTVFLEGKYAKQTQFHSPKCRSEAQIRLWRTKRTQFQDYKNRASKICKTNPICE